MDKADIRQYTSSWTCINGHITKLQFAGKHYYGDEDLHWIGGSEWDICDHCGEAPTKDDTDAAYQDIRSQFVAAQQHVLVIPKEAVNERVPFTPWDQLKPRLAEFNQRAGWMIRQAAERSLTDTQVIPCTYIRNAAGCVYVARRVAAVRDDLSGHLSLIFGGHVDQTEDMRETFLSTITHALERELLEETGVIMQSQPVGLVLDTQSERPCRHVGFVHETQAEDVQLQAPEEFLEASGAFKEPGWIAERRQNFDPWSQLLIRHRISK